VDRLFAPWRIEWVAREDRNPGVEGCVFCALPDLDHREHRVVARNDHAYVLLNDAPYNPGHAMVIPDRHLDDYTDLGPDELFAHARLTQRTLRAMDAGLDPDGYNTGFNLGPAGGASVADHVHRHVVPRYDGDTNFMPVVADTAVVVEGIEDTYDRLWAAFREQEGAAVDDADPADDREDPDGDAGDADPHPGAVRFSSPSTSI
jgi:ATP adenylyltransferase